MHVQEGPSKVDENAKNKEKGSVIQNYEVI